jgi:hypothetical protein
MKTIVEQHVPHNTGCSGEVKEWPTIRITANSPFNLVTHENRWHDRADGAHAGSPGNRLT